MKPTSCNKILHKRHEQLVFYILILFLKHFKQLEPFIFCGTKAYSFEDEKDIVSVPYLTVFGYPPYNSLRILKPYSTVFFNLENFT